MNKPFAAIDTLTGDALIEFVIRCRQMEKPGYGCAVQSSKAKA